MSTEANVNPEVAVNQFTPTGTENGAANPLTVHKVSITTDDLDDFRKWQADKRNRRITELSKKYGNDVGSRRNTLVLRRVNCREIAPDEDVLSYLLIYAMKEPYTVEGKKVSVTDNEIKAYLALDYEFTASPSLEALKAKVKELGGTEPDENADQVIN